MPSSPATRAFHIGDLLSIVTGVVLSPRGEMGVAALHTYLLGRPVPLSEAPRIHPALRAHVVALYPGLDGYLEAEVPTYEFAGAWVRRRAREHGTYLPLPPLPRDHPLHAELDAVAVDDTSRIPYAAALAEPDPERARPRAQRRTPLH